MYGFALTVYFLASLLPLDVPIGMSSGHLWSTFPGFGRFGTAIEVLLASPPILLGMLLVVKGWVRIYFSRDELVTSGVYGTIRHPQYAGMLLIIAGLLVNRPALPILIAPVIVWLYLGLAAREDRSPEERFRKTFDEYSDNVPRFFPHWRDPTGHEPVTSGNRSTVCQA